MFDTSMALTQQIKEMRLSVQNHKETIQQNRCLQSELRKANDEIIRLQNKIKELEKRPFFPYPMNDGRRKDYGEFYLISHAWFSFLNTTQQVGIVEVEWKSGNHCLYIGLGSGVPNLKMFDFEVKNIALYGHKLKEFD